MNWYEKGGAAFPIPHSNEPGAYEAETGMSLHDWFAGQANEQDIVEHQEYYEAEPGRWVAKYTRAQARFRFADAMLAARSAK